MQNRTWRQLFIEWGNTPAEIKELNLHSQGLLAGVDDPLALLSGDSAETLDTKLLLRHQMLLQYYGHFDQPVAAIQSEPIVLEALLKECEQNKMALQKKKLAAGSHFSRLCDQYAALNSESVQQHLAKYKKSLLIGSLGDNKSVFPASPILISKRLYALIVRIRPEEAAVTDLQFNQEDKFHLMEYQTNHADIPYGLSVMKYTNKSGQVFYLQEKSSATGVLKLKSRCETVFGPTKMRLLQTPHHTLCSERRYDLIVEPGFTADWQIFQIKEHKLEEKDLYRWNTSGPTYKDFVEQPVHSSSSSFKVIFSTEFSAKKEDKNEELMGHQYALRLLLKEHDRTSRAEKVCDDKIAAVTSEIQAAETSYTNAIGKDQLSIAEDSLSKIEEAQKDLMSERKGKIHLLRRKQELTSKITKHREAIQSLSSDQSQAGAQAGDVSLREDNLSKKNETDLNCPLPTYVHGVRFS